MNAAIYARKSRPEEGRHEAEKSVTRQKDEAQAYASARAGP
jgi:DNA invertase Pin-like site-specific DNA recombinase